MVYSIQNSETGELDYIFNDVSESEENLDYDEETGEPITNELKCNYRYTKSKNFQIPKKLLKGTECEELFKRIIEEDLYAEKESNTIQYKIIDENSQQQQLTTKKHQYNRDAYMNMEGVKNDIILAYKKSNILLFLIPTLLFHSIFVAVIVILIEIFLHCWSHMRNGLNMNKKIYFRSPLHVLTSQFCATCRWESENRTEIFRMLNMQMRQAREFKTLKNVSKALS